MIPLLNLIKLPIADGLRVLVQPYLVFGLGPVSFTLAIVLPDSMQIFEICEPFGLN